MGELNRNGETRSGYALAQMEKLKGRVELVRIKKILIDVYRYAKAKSLSKRQLAATARKKKERRC